MLAWCVVPVFSALANMQAFPILVRSELYQILAWGVPYFFGRVYFTDTVSLRMAAKAFVIAGMAYVPICLIEIFTGPQIYAHLYGYQPYRWIGAERYVGFRPIGLLEDGNQLGIWMATSALIAIWLWRRRLVAAIFGVPIGWISGILLGHHASLPVGRKHCYPALPAPVCLYTTELSAARYRGAVPSRNSCFHGTSCGQLHIPAIPGRTQRSCPFRRRVFQGNPAPIFRMAAFPGRKASRRGA